MIIDFISGDDYEETPIFNALAKAYESPIFDRLVDEYLYKDIPRYVITSEPGESLKLQRVEKEMQPTCKLCGHDFTAHMNNELKHEFQTSVPDPNETKVAHREEDSIKAFDPSYTGVTLMDVVSMHPENAEEYMKADVELTKTVFKPVNECSNLVRHARFELERLGEEPAIIEQYVQMIQFFADMGHSGGSASVFIPVLHDLLQFKNLLPLTDDPDEWYCHDREYYGVGQDLWQSKRNSEAFSTDGGKSYYILSEDVHENGDLKRTYHRSIGADRGRRTAVEEAVSA